MECPARPPVPAALAFQASDLKVKNFVRFPAVNGSALDASRLVSPRALADIMEGARPARRWGWCDDRLGWAEPRSVGPARRHC